MEEKEQLYRDVNPKKQILLKEEAKAKEEVVEAPKEEPVETSVVEEPVVEEVEKVKPKKTKKLKAEKLSEEEEAEDVEEVEETDAAPEEVAEEEPTEEVAEPAEEPAEAPAEEVPAEEPVEEPKAEEAEAPKDEEVKEEPEAENNEKLEATKKELGVIAEVREELVALYAQNKDLEAEKEQLSKKNIELTDSVEKLESQLQRYKEAEEKLATKKKLDRLEKLSAKFKLLGQTKTVEQLQAKDDETIEEFEKIVDAAVDKVEETKEEPAVTESSQGESLKDEGEVAKVAPPAPKAVAKPVEQLSNEKFFKGICNKMAVEQTAPNKGKRATYL